MDSAEGGKRPDRSVARRYLFAALACGATTVVQWFLWEWLSPLAFILLYLGVIFAAWYGGQGPGLFATALSAISAMIFFLPHPFSSEAGQGLKFGLLAYLSVSVIVSHFLGRFYAATGELARLLEGERAARARVERAQAERAETVALLDALLSSVSVGIGFVDTDLRYLRINGALASFNGVSVEAHLGRTLGELRPEFWPVVEPLLRRVLETGTPLVDIEVHNFAEPLDQRRYWLASYYPVRLPAGGVVGIGGILHEVTALRRAELELRESEERFRSTFQHAQVGIAHVAPDGVWLRVNPRLCEILGYSAEELATLSFQRITHPEDLPKDLELLGRLARGEIQSYELEKRYIRKDGLPVWINLAASSVRNPQGEVRFYIAVVEDITERKGARERLAALYEEAQRAIRARDEFLTVASHELKTPLTSLVLQVDGLKRWSAKAGPAVPERVSRGIELISRQTERLGALVGTLLDATRLERGRLELHLEQANLASILQEVIERFSEVAHREGCELRLEGTAHLPGCWDVSRLDQVFSNLLSNAIKYGPGQPIRVMIEARDGVAVVEVADRGIGIPPEALARIFGRFERAVSERQYGGLGLGLYIAGEIVAAHGGTIEARSLPGEGATFVVHLPTGLVPPGRQAGGSEETQHG